MLEMHLVHCLKAPVVNYRGSCGVEHIQQCPEYVVQILTLVKSETILHMLYRYKDPNHEWSQALAQVAYRPLYTLS